jgi:hypothetical protein
MRVSKYIVLQRTDAFSENTCFKGPSTWGVQLLMMPLMW